MDPLKAGTLNLKPPTQVANSQPVQMTRAEYQAKYGALPAQEPVKMTRAEYQAKYGSLPETPQQPKTLGQNVLGAAKGASNFINQNIARPFVDLAAMPVQKLAKSLGQPDPYADKALAGIDVAPVDKPLRKVGSAIEAGSYAFPFGTVTRGATALAKPVLGKIAPKVGNVAAGLAGGYGVDVGMNLSQGKEGSEAFKPGLGTVIGGAIPGVTEVGGAIKRRASNQAPRIINSLIKPLLKDFSYGKNPGRTVAELGITGNDLDELATNITTYKNQVGRQTRELSQSLPNGSIVFLGEALNPINEAIQKAAASNNATVVRRLQEVKAALTRNLGLGKNGEIGSLGTKSWYKTGNSTYLDGLALKQQVGNLTKFTGNPSDDKEVNMALKRVYGSIKESLDKSATKANPEVAAKLRKANEQYADLQSAETATVYRDKIQQRSNLVGLTPTLAGIGSGIAALTVTGGSALPSLIAAGGGVLVDKALSSPAFKTRLAKWLAKLAPADRDLVEASFPKLQTIGDDLIGRSRDIIKETGGNRGFSKIPPVLRGSTLPKQPLMMNGKVSELGKKIVATGEQKPTLKLKRDVSITTLSGEKVTIPEDEVLRAYESGGKALLKDGREYIVSKSQYENIKNNSLKSEAKDFAPELKGTEETVKGHTHDVEIYNQYVRDLKAKYDPSGRMNMSMLFDELPISEQIKFTEMKKAQDTVRDTGTKYSSYQLPDGKNYKEVLIKAPTNSPAEKLHIEKDGTGFRIVDSNGQRVGPKRTGTTGDYWMKLETQAEADAALRQFTKKYTQTDAFKSSHWDEPNVISHLRLNERTYNGKKVTFMEELQSDWAREGRSKGFKTSETSTEIERLRARQKEISELAKPYTSKGEDAPRKMVEESVAISDRLNALRDKEYGAVPNNPLLKNWQTLSVKRALKEAVDNDSEYFAWINGEQTSARYNLATHVDTVKWGTGGNGYAGKMIYVNAKGGRDIIIKIDDKGNILQGKTVPTDWVGKPLDSALGKGLADKIMEKETGTLSGEGLKFGGEWASNLYDKQVGNIVKDLTGAKIETLDLGLTVGGKKNPIYTLSGNHRDVGAFANADNVKKGDVIADANGKEIIVISKIGQEFSGVPVKVYETAKNPRLIKEDKYAWTFDVAGRDTDFGKGAFATKEDALASAKNVGIQRLDEQAIDIRFAKESDLKSQTQQGIKITPEIRAMVKGEAPKLK